MMAETKCDPIKKIVLPRVPILVSKKNMTVLNDQMSMKFRKQIKSIYREDVIYENKNGEYLKGESRRVTIVNRLNVLTNHSRTIAKYFIESQLVEELTSDAITNLIGPKNYDIVFSAILSVINQEQKIRSLLALLTTQKKCNVMSQTIEEKPIKTEVDILNIKEPDPGIFKKRRRVRRQQVKPYVVKEEFKPLKKIVVNPDLGDVSLKQEMSLIKDEHMDTLKEVHELKTETNDESSFDLTINDDSDCSLGSMSLTGLSVTDSVLCSLEKIIQPNTPELRFDPCKLDVSGGNQVMLPIKPKDIFHIATQDILKNVTREEQHQLLWKQALIDFKSCRLKGDDDNLPIHTAVIQNDLDLLRRHCILLRRTPETVDALSGAGLTALQLSVLNNSSAECIRTLLKYGADPLYSDVEHKTIIHLAAESSPDNMRVLLDHCRTNARQILHEDEDLWKNEFEHKSDEQLGIYLLRYICQMCDSQGYTPLMLASRIGNHDNVKQLIEASPTTVNMTSPSSGDTALFIAVGAACLDSENRGNRSKVADNFLKTIDILLDKGGDISINNHSGANVNVTLQEYNISELSMLIANKLTAVKSLTGDMTNIVATADRFVLIKESNDYETPSSKSTTKVVKSAGTPVSNKPQILGNVSVHLPCESPKWTGCKVMLPHGNMPDKRIIDKPGNIVLKKQSKIYATKSKTILLANHSEAGASVDPAQAAVSDVKNVSMKRVSNTLESVPCKIKKIVKQ